jgi:RNA polymerase sigma-70 factor, ECF subfamily
MSLSSSTSDRLSSIGLADALRRLAAGHDGAAWDALLIDVGPALSRLCQRITCDAALAEDALQETLLQLRDCAGKFRADSADCDARARRWIMQVAANSAFHLVRARHRRDRRERQQPSGRPSAIDPHQQAVSNENDIAVRQALAQLPETRRSAIVLHVMEGIGYEDVARDLNIPIGTAKTHVTRGLEILRRHLQRAGVVFSVGAVTAALQKSPASELPFTLASWQPLLTAAGKPAALIVPATGGMTVLAKIILVGAVITAIGSVPMAVALGSQTTPTLPFIPSELVTAAEEFHGDEQAPEAWRVDMNNRLLQKISFDFEDEKFEEAIAFIQRTAGINIVLESRIYAEGGGAITLNVKDMKLDHVLGWMLELTKLHRVIVDEAIYIYSDGPDPATLLVGDSPLKGSALEQKLSQQISMSFQNQDLASILEFLSRITDEQFRLEPADAALAATPITLNVQSMTLQHVLNHLMRLAQCRYHCTEGGVVIYRAEPELLTSMTPSEPAPTATKANADDWLEKLSARLQQHVTMEFVDHDVVDVVAFLQRVSNVNIVFDPTIIAAGCPAVDLVVTDVTVQAALDHLTSKAGLRYEFRDEAVFITMAAEKGRGPLHDIFIQPKAPLPPTDNQ